MQIAIDGPTASGKSTIARLLAQRLGFLYLDTGAMYRALGLATIDAGIDRSDQKSVVELLKNLDIGFIDQKIHIGDVKAESRIRTEEVGRAASDIAVIPEVRRIMTEKQRALAKGTDIVMDGRDIGTVVLPDADLKIFLTASVQARAARRLADLKKGGIQIDIAQVEKIISERDFQDKNRTESPLALAADAIEIDSSNLSISEVISKIERLL